MTGDEPECPWAEDSTLFALHALEPRQEESVAAHVRSCTGCQATVREVEETFAAVGETAAVSPPPQLRRRILAATQEQLPPATPPITRPRRTVRLAQPYEPVASRSRFRRWAIAAAAAVLVAGMAGGGVAIAQLDRQRDAATVHADTLDDLPTAIAAFPHAVLVDRDRHPVAAVALDDPPQFYDLDLPAPPPGREWVLWGARGQTVAALTVVPARDGVSTAVPAGRPGEYQAYLLSQEAAGPLPTRPGEVSASGPLSSATGS